MSMTCSQKTGHSKLEFSGIINNFKNVIIAYETLKIYGIADFLCSATGRDWSQGRRSLSEDGHL